MRSSKSINRRALLASTAAAMVATPAIVRAQGGPLKVGVLLPRSGAQAVIGRDCQRAVELAPPILKDLGLPDLAIMNADTESNVDTARARRETDQRRCAASGRCLRFRPHDRDRPGFEHIAIYGRWLAPWNRERVVLVSALGDKGILTVDWHGALCC
jgi:hypothetical protein